MKQNWKRFCSCLLLCCMLATNLFVTNASAANFKDVPTGHWAAESIYRCAAKGFFKGKSATTFGLRQSMTRSAAVVVLDRFFGWESVDVPMPYTDVPETAWYADALRSAYAMGAVTAQTKTFRPSDPITREELAVMLIRALGYNTVAGVAQDLPQTFQDVRSNEGYIAMARDFGLVTGIRTDYFSPKTYATREQVAVILMRLYDKLQDDSHITLGIADEAADVTGVDIAAVADGTLNSNGTVRASLNASKVTAIRAAAKAEGAHLALYVRGTANFLDRYSAAAVDDLVKAVSDGSYSGLVLEVTGATAAQREALSSFAKSLSTALEEKALTLVVTAPTQSNGLDAAAGGYDYSALSNAADRVVVRIPQLVDNTGGFPLAPMEALEEVFWGLSQLKQAGVDMEEVSLMLTAKGSRYSGTRDAGDLTGTQIEQLLEDDSWQEEWSQRYGCACLERTNGNEAVWYLNGRAAEERLQMLRLFGAEGVCLDDPAGAAPGLLDALQ